VLATGLADLDAGQVRRSLLAVLTSLALVGAAGCDPLDEPPSGYGPPDSQSSHAAVQDPTQTKQALEELTVAPWGSMAHYSRDRFPHWVSQGHGCDTRDVVLQKQGQSVVTTPECGVTSGTWFSAYDGKTVSDPHSVDIDHMVPLANAWRTGASQWTDDKRSEFANDLTRPQLLAVTLSSNRSKGDQDPSQWKPPREAFWCTYAEDWVAVKSYWRLTVTAEEKGALLIMLETC
jgi:Protein of unknown function (DUF1524)